MERPRPLPGSDDLALELSEPLRRHFQRMVGNRETAEDLLQETLLRMARALPAFEGRASAKTWAFAIAMRVIADHFRAPEERVQIVDLDERIGQSVDDVPVGEVAVDERMVVDEMNACVRGVIDSLPEDYRAALVLHDLEGLTASQVAEISGCSVATAKIRIHRARARLKAALRAACSFYRDGEGVFRCDQSHEAVPPAPIHHAEKPRT
jgi:RNA polymerase sigma-70 factor (ECF subfamily)